MLFKRAGSPFWYVRYRDGSGKRIKRSTGTSDRREAEELEAKWRLEAREQRIWGTQPRYTFDELMLRYLKETQDIKRSAETDAWYAKALTRYFSGKVLCKLKRSDAAESRWTEGRHHQPGNRAALLCDQSRSRRVGLGHSQPRSRHARTGRRRAAGIPYA